MTESSTIRILPAQLANQIAAGEVVERPSSVVKELLENSIDAGATAIDVDIEKGGHKRIAIRDNGKGIDKTELELALSRHATSKISSLEDLESVASMGFRGEALASISSVSRLTLTSRTAAQSEAWQAQAEGRDMSIEVTPAAHPVGTSLLVEDLFFNTPARRKFLKSEKTEFMHIDEVIRRIVLSRFDVSISVKHNGKLLRKYVAATEGADPYKRISKACGQRFCDNALEVESQYQDMLLKGWLVNVHEAHTSIDTQYFYVNGRIMRDKLINHAIRQAFTLLLGPEAQPSYILYLTLPADAIDINVHPAKHEVRFHQARLVHDFIVRTLQEFLMQASDLSQQGAETAEQNIESQAAMKVFDEVAPNHDYIQPLKSADNRLSESTGQYQSSQVYRAPSYNASAGKQYRQLLQPNDAATTETAIEKPLVHWLSMNNGQLLIQSSTNFYLLSHAALFAAGVSLQLSSYLPASQPLLLPISVSFESEKKLTASRISEVLSTLNVDLNVTNKKMMLRKVPAGMRELDWVSMLSYLIELSEDEIQSTSPITLLTRALSDADITIPEHDIPLALNRLGSDDLAQLLQLHGDKVPLQAWIDGEHNEVSC
jgi:DNA mismatch repair protein MutL